MPESPALTITVLDAEAYRAAIPDLAALIVDAVATGAGVNFLEGVTVDEAAAWWRARETDVASGRTTPFVAIDDGRVVGSTLLIRSVNQNSPHRAEIGKVIVLGSHRRRGLASALMRAAEDRARAEGRWLLVLDTVSGSAGRCLLPISRLAGDGRRAELRAEPGRAAVGGDVLLEGPAVSGSGSGERTVLIAPDSFKGSLTPVAVAWAIADGWRRARPHDRVLLSPLADGGEGTLVSVEAAGGWDWHEVAATDPIDRPVRARWLRSSDGRRAVVELAEASGLSRLTPEERDPTGASTFGTGQVLRAVIDSGVEEVTIGIGGSATTDGGFGILEALGVRSDPERDGFLHLDQLGYLANIDVRVACDVTNPLLGARGAAATYGPQKGASPEQVSELDAHLERYADQLAEGVGRDERETPGRRCGRRRRVRPVVDPGPVSIVRPAARRRPRHGADGLRGEAQAGGHRDHRRRSDRRPDRVRQDRARGGGARCGGGRRLRGGRRRSRGGRDRRAGPAGRGGGPGRRAAAVRRGGDDGRHGTARTVWRADRPVGVAVVTPGSKPRRSKPKRPKKRRFSNPAASYAKRLERYRPGLVPFVLDELASIYGHPVWERRQDPTSELILTILTQNSADVNAEVAFEALRTAYPSGLPVQQHVPGVGWGGVGLSEGAPPDWERVEFAPLPELTDVIRPGGLANQKAPRLQATLRRIREERGDYSLEFLGDMPALEARDWLTQIDGIGKKTASVLLLFCFNSPLLPIDRHIDRVMHRVGILYPNNLPLENAHDLVLGMFEPDQMFEAHVNLIQHGRRICHAQRPAHELCPLRERCRFVDPKAP